MDKTYFDAYNLNWLYEILVKNGLNCSMIGDGYYMFKNSKVVCFINLGEPMHPNVDLRLAIDNAKVFNKIGQIPISIDIMQPDENLVLKWIKFLSTKEGLNYSSSFEYLDDESRPCYIYS